MECVKCGNKINENLVCCPYCGNRRESSELKNQFSIIEYVQEKTYREKIVEIIHSKFYLFFCVIFSCFIFCQYIFNISIWRWVAHSTELIFCFALWDIYLNGKKNTSIIRGVQVLKIICIVKCFLVAVVGLLVCTWGMVEKIGIILLVMVMFFSCVIGSYWNSMRKFFSSIVQVLSNDNTGVSISVYPIILLVISIFTNILGFFVASFVRFITGWFINLTDISEGRISYLITSVFDYTGLNSTEEYGMIMSEFRTYMEPVRELIKGIWGIAGRQSIIVLLLSIVVIICETLFLIELFQFKSNYKE